MPFWNVFTWNQVEQSKDCSYNGPGVWLFLLDKETSKPFWEFCLIYSTLKTHIKSPYHFYFLEDASDRVLVMKNYKRADNKCEWLNALFLQTFVSRPHGQHRLLNTKVVTFVYLISHKCGPIKKFNERIV